mmetsp:Transcript_43023/g.135598  ORF Transcript_43023/g.135598 Transcript_43023/m.135598 type:complete len:298 (-) Transcript_43023:430-1323(-)
MCLLLLELHLPRCLLLCSQLLFRLRQLALLGRKAALQLAAGSCYLVALQLQGLPQGCDIRCGTVLQAVLARLSRLGAAQGLRDLARRLELCRLQILELFTAAAQLGTLLHALRLRGAKFALRSSELGRRGALLLHCGLQLGLRSIAVGPSLPQLHQLLERGLKLRPAGGGILAEGGEIAESLLKHLLLLELRALQLLQFLPAGLHATQGLRQPLFRGRGPGPVGLLPVQQLLDLSVGRLQSVLKFAKTLVARGGVLLQLLFQLLPAPPRGKILLLLGLEVTLKPAILLLQCLQLALS